MPKARFLGRYRRPIDALPAAEQSEQEPFAHPDFRRWALTGRNFVRAEQTSTTDASGGYLVGEAGQAVIAAYIDQASVMRRLCGVQSVSSGSGVPWASQTSASRHQARFESQGDQYNKAAGDAAEAAERAKKLNAGTAKRVHDRLTAAGAVSDALADDIQTAVAAAANQTAAIAAANTLIEAANLTDAEEAADKAIVLRIINNYYDGKAATARDAAEAVTDLVYTGGILNFDTLVSPELEVHRELLEDSAVDLESEIIATITSWLGNPLDNAYTLGTGSSIIQGLGESSLLQAMADGSEIGDLDTPYLIGRTMLGLLNPAIRRNAQFMGTWATMTALMVSEKHFAATSNVPGGDAEIMWLNRRYVENESMTGALTYDAATGKAATVTAMTGIPLFAGDIARYYRIFDVGGIEIHRNEDSLLRSERKVGFRVSLRTAGRLVGPANCVVKGS